MSGIQIFYTDEALKELTLTQLFREARAARDLRKSATTPQTLIARQRAFQDLIGEIRRRGTELAEDGSARGGFSGFGMFLQVLFAVACVLVAAVVERAGVLP